MKKVIILLLMAGLAGCDGDILSDSYNENLEALKVFDVLSESDADSAMIRFTTSIPSTSRIEYGTVSGTYSETVSGSQSSETTHTIEITGLAANTTYYARYIVSADGHDDVVGTEFSFITYSTITVSGLVVSGTDLDSTNIAWTTNVTTTHIVEYGTVSGSYTYSTIQSTSEAVSHTVTLTGLQPNTVYYYRIKNYHATLGTSTGAEQSFTTAAGVSEIPSASGIGINSASIGWTTNFVTTHIAEYGTVSGTYTSTTIQSSSASTSHTVSLTGLSSGTTYYYRVKNFSSSYGNTVSSEYSFTTLTEAAPTLAQKLRGIWIVGGLSGGGSTATIAHGTTIADLEFYDPITNTWYSDFQDLPIPVSFAGVESIKISSNDHRIYVFGGFDHDGNTCNNVQYYTIETDTWSTGTVLTAARANINACRIENKIYIMGGTTGALVSTNWAGAATTYEYSPISDEWVFTRTAFGAATSNRFMFSFNDVIYNFGGRTSATATTATHDGYIYTTSNGALTTGTTEVPLNATATNGRIGFAGAMYTPSNGPPIVIIIGGSATVLTSATGCSILQGNASAPISTVQYLAYPFAAPSAWVSPTGGSVLTYPNAVAFGSAVVYYSSSLTPNYRLYHFGGTQSLTASSASGWNAVRWCDMPPHPATWTNIQNNGSVGWGTAASMNTGRYGHTAVMIQQ